MQIGEDARLAPFYHMLAEAAEVAGPGAARVDRRGHPALPRELVRIDAERGAAPIDVGVQVDEPRHDDFAGDIADVGRGSVMPAHACDLAAREGDVGNRVEVLGRVDDTTVAED